VARVTFIVLAILGCVTGAIFAFAPTLDLEVASFFHELAIRPDVANLYAKVEFVRDLSSLITIATIAPAIIVVAMKIFRPKRPTFMSSRAALFLILSLTLGPGILVNGLLKEGWARPRPGMVTEFGGDYVFKPWWDPRGTCDSNCSFVSGEASSAIWMVAPAVLAPAPWNYVAVGAAVVYSAAIAFLRMLVGGHFLTDVIFAGIFTCLVVWVVHGFFYRWPNRPTESVLDAALEHIGSAISRLFAGMLQTRNTPEDKPTPPA
jgi:lipid A 4'-phosphatase